MNKYEKNEIKSEIEELMKDNEITMEEAIQLYKDLHPEIEDKIDFIFEEVEEDEQDEVNPWYVSNAEIPEAAASKGEYGFIDYSKGEQNIGPETDYLKDPMEDDERY